MTIECAIWHQTTYSRVPNKRTGLLLENGKKSHLNALIRNYMFNYFLQKVPPVHLFQPICLFYFGKKWPTCAANQTFLQEKTNNRNIFHGFFRNFWSGFQADASPWLPLRILMGQSFFGHKFYRKFPTYTFIQSYTIIIF